MIIFMQTGSSSFDEKVQRLSGSQLGGAVDCVSEEDILYARRKRRTADCRRTLAGRAALRLVASHHQGRAMSSASELPIRRSCGRCGENHGKPMVEGTSLSSATSADRVIAAAGTIQQHIGVDLEAIPRVLPPGFDAYTLHDREYAELGAGPHVVGRDVKRHPQRCTADTEARVGHWALKESVLKASGRGLEHPPHQLLLGRPEAFTTWHGCGSSGILAWRPVLESADPAVRGFCCALPGHVGFAAALAARVPEDIAEWGCR